ncbi:hypothetical protein PR202_gb28161 [Eleusine coracana subsp. coracana]|uniref:Uncharacterized protein n=1 Tax=Eleusine coracana subsp. coracana TaxID=191504 RepID=A0AAV5FWE7_ELECO|nr:hypothetical protein PR202_gb28161 [Eleusine coracana subsp. coracana]
MPNTCTDLTEAVRSVQLFKINGFTATKEKSGFIASTIWTVGGHDWQMEFEPNNEGWMKMRLSLVSEASSEVPASFSCRLVHPAESPSQEKTVSSLFHRNNTSVDLPLTKRVDLEASGYVKDESFLVHCAINVLVGDEPAAAAATVTETCPCTDLQNDLGELLRCQKGADINFFLVSGGESVAAHRCVLVARSPVFAAELLGETTKEKTSQCIEIRDMEAEVFKAMLHFIYTDTSPELETKGTSIARRLLEAADRYGLERLKGLCVEKLCTSISMDTVATTLALAEQHGCSKLKANCMNFILADITKFHEISATEGYMHLEARCPSVLTEVLKLMVHQRQVILIVAIE